MRFPALTDPGASFGRAKYAQGRREIEERFDFWRRMQLVPEMHVQRRSIDDFSRVKQIVRIEGRLHPAHERITVVPDHEADELPAEAPIAVFTRERAPVFLHEGCDVRGDVAEHLSALFGFEIEKRTGVQLAGARMGIVDAADPVLALHEGIELADVRRQIFDRNRGVLHDLAGLRIAAYVVHDALSSATEIPDLVAVVPPQSGKGIADAGSAEVSFEAVELLFEKRAVGVPKLDYEHGTRIANDEETVLRLLQIGFRALQDMAIDELAAGGSAIHRNHGWP